MASAMTPIINELDDVFPDDTSVTVSEPANSDIVKLGEEKSTNISIKCHKIFSDINYS